MTQVLLGIKVHTFYLLFSLQSNLTLALLFLKFIFSRRAPGSFRSPVFLPVKGGMCFFHISISVIPNQRVLYLESACGLNELEGSKTCKLTNSGNFVLKTATWKSWAVMWK